MGKTRFSEVIDRALTDGPQTITRKGKKAVVVVSAEEWHGNTKRKGNLRSCSQPRPSAALTSRLSGPKMDRVGSSCEFSPQHHRGVGIGQAETR